MRERETTGPLDLTIAWLVFFVLGVDCSLSAPNSLSDTLNDTWLFAEDESLSEFPGGTIRGSARLFLFLLVPFLWTEPVSELEEEDWCLLWSLALEGLVLWCPCERYLEWRLARWECCECERLDLRWERDRLVLLWEWLLSWTPRSRTRSRSWVWIRSGSRRWSPLASSQMWSWFTRLRSWTPTTTWPMRYSRFSGWTASRNLRLWSRTIMSVCEDD